MLMQNQLSLYTWQGTDETLVNAQTINLTSATVNLARSRLHRKQVKESDF